MERLGFPAELGVVVAKHLGSPKAMERMISYLNYVKPKKVSVFVEANTEAEIIDEEREICFELRIKRAKWIRTYADVLVITNDKVFSLEFKMKDKADPEERGKEFD